MKKTLVAAMTLFIVVLASCSKVEVENTPQLSPASIAVKSEKNIKNRDLMYNSLTTQEMKDLWINHLNYCLTTYTLNSNQVGKINQGKTLLNAGVLDNPDENAFDIWVAASSIDFPSVKQQYMVFGTLSEYTNTEFTNTDPIPYVPNGEAGNDNDCSCSQLKYHDFCGSANSTFIGHGSYLHYCENTSCNLRSRGCGWFWRKGCTADCVQHFVPSGGHT